MNAAGTRMPLNDWLDLNNRRIFEDHTLRSLVAPFPPAELMRDVSATDDERAFASHGTDIFQAVAKCSPKDLNAFESILDFGCGCGRLGRIFLGHPARVTGCDIDARHIGWINSNLPYMSAVKTEPNVALPFDDNSFDAVISVSVFSHITEKSQLFYLDEIRRVTKSGAYLFLSTHGENALRQVRNSERMFNLVGIPRETVANASSRMYCGMYTFIGQSAGHPTERDYDYGITFIPSSYIERVWSQYFEIVQIASGAIHDWQDIVVCRKR